jgi:alpha-beta hydrolase superfamily lysophospholipase
MTILTDILEAGPALEGSRMDAIAIDGLFGWLHRPSSIGGDTGVVLISPLGRDERCAHAPMRLFADDLAAAGFATLRYDHRGEGDSLGLTAPEADATQVWLADIRSAVDRFRALTGVRRVVLGGVRMGATFAALAGGGADGLMLLAPVLSGRSWLQKMRFSGGGTPEGGIDFSGLYLGAATVAGLAEIDLGHGAPPTCPLFLAAQNRLVRAYGQDLDAAGLSPDVHDFPGYDALFADAHSNEPPIEVFAAARAWLARTFADRTLADPPSAKPAAVAELRPPGARERAVSFGESLQGVLSMPDRGGPAGQAVLICNTGGDPRAGIGGFATTAARALAARGVASLRFDFQGLGDSAPAAPDQRGHIYETPREADLEAAVSLLAAEGYSQVVALGICAGAYHAVRLAARDPRVAGAFAISPAKLVWRSDDSLAFGRRDDGKSTESYVKALRDPAVYRRLLMGGVDVRTIARNLAKRLRGRLLGFVDQIAGRSPLTALRQLSRRGGRVHMLMGTDDVSQDEVETWFGPRARRMTRLPGMTVEVDPRLDHGLARLGSRQLALVALLAWLGLAAE